MLLDYDDGRLLAVSETPNFLVAFRVRSVYYTPLCTSSIYLRTANSFTGCMQTIYVGAPPRHVPGTQSSTVRIRWLGWACDLVHAHHRFPAISVTRASVSSPVVSCLVVIVNGPAAARVDSPLALFRRAAYGLCIPACNKQKPSFLKVELTEQTPTPSRRRRTLTSCKNVALADDETQGSTSGWVLLTSRVVKKKDPRAVQQTMHHDSLTSVCTVCDRFSPQFAAPTAPRAASSCGLLCHGGRAAKVERPIPDCWDRRPCGTPVLCAQSQALRTW
ncbi:hypothetical protein N657DRAFT_243683 [Parathielavia appendiculata]|uniref:Uncharacterized protein n=1 Tax=Parathielavia appendiculata TaxID=2587402 RepID=A0AAN6TSM2_9PEZI|nr:hypothetical protein N657DRAFT_243683 [Parathielavia appendiculata]